MSQNEAFYVYLLTVLGSQRVVVKCTAAILFCTVDSVLELLPLAAIFLACEQASRSRITRTVGAQEGASHLVAGASRRPINLLRSSKPGACSQATIFWNLT